MIEQGVLYLCCGTLHAAHLIVSIASLKRHCKGPIAIVADAVGMPLAERIAADPWLGSGAGVTAISLPATIPATTRSECLIAKTALPRLSPFANTAYLDCDTLVVDKIHRLFATRPEQVRLTNFACLTTRSRKIRTRIYPWQPYEPQQVARILAGNWLAINTGVMAWGPESRPFTDAWRELATRSAELGDDEIAAQIVYPSHDFRILPWYYNASVAYDTHRDPGPVKIWHGHAGRFLKRPTGRKLWLPVFAEAIERNYADIRSLPFDSRCRQPEPKQPPVKPRRHRVQTSRSVVFKFRLRKIAR